MPPVRHPDRDSTRLTQFSNDGLTFDVADSGPVEGPLVVLLHGFPQRATCWRRVSDRLNNRGYRTLAPDQRGYSPRARPRGRSAYRLSHLVSDVEALMRRVDAPVHLVGHDWGAVVAWACAARAPSLTRSLVTVSVPHPRAFRRSMLTSTQPLRSWYAAAFQLPVLPETVAQKAPALVEASLRRSGMAEDAVARFRREMVEDGALGPALAWYRAVPFDRSPLAADNLVRVPTTHVWSDGDVALSRRGAELCGDYVRAPYRLAVLKGVSHWIPEEAPALLAALIDERAASVTGAA